MKDDLLDEKRRAIVVDRARLHTAVAALETAATRPLRLGHHASRAPWIWLLAGGAIGAWLGIRNAGAR